MVTLLLEQLMLLDMMSKESSLINFRSRSGP